MLKLHGLKGHLGSGGRNQPHGGHVGAADRLDFLDVPVALFIHQLGRGDAHTRTHRYITYTCIDFLY